MSIKVYKLNISTKRIKNFNFLAFFDKSPVSELSFETICSAILIEYSICCTIQHAAFLYWDVRKDDKKTGELKRKINRDLNRCDFFTTLHVALMCIHVALMCIYVELMCIHVALIMMYVSAWTS